MPRRTKRIQNKLIRVIMLTCGIVLLLTCTAFLTYEYLTYRSIAKQELTTIARIVAANSTAAIAFQNQEDADEVLSALSLKKQVMNATLLDTSGRIFASFPKDSTVQYDPEIERNGYVFRKSSLQIKVPVVQSGDTIGSLYIRSDLSSINSQLILYYVITIIFFVLAFVCAFLLSRRLQEAITKPILHLAKTARQVSENQDYSVRAQKMSNDETAVLTDAFNHMLEQIETQNEQIIALNHSLEEKVSKRTNQLQSLNKELQVQNEFIQTVIDSSIDLIAVFDKDHKYVMLNKRGTHIYKRPADDMIGKNVLEVFPSLKGTRMISNLEKAFHGEFIHDEAYKSLVSDRYFENFFIPLKDENLETTKVMVIGHDITNLQRAAEELKSLNASLGKSNRDLEQFAYVASHDLQEPLRKIQTFSELSVVNIQKPEILTRYLDKIGSSAKRMTELIKAVLNYSKLSVVENFESIDLNEILNNIINDLELLIDEKHACINISKLPVIKGIPLQMNQLFLNLITNALKFVDREPLIEINGRRMQHTEAIAGVHLPEGEYHEISIKDNGIGLEDEYRERIFSIFQRLHSTNKYEGTGIGLALCKKIAENHKGGIGVISHPESGSVFYVYFPA